MTDRPGSMPGKAITVLIVDDEPDIRLLVRVIVDAADGIEVIDEAIDGPEALEAIDHLGPPPVPTVMILDNHMPSMTGLEVAERVIASVPSQRVILFSAYLTDEVRQRATELGIAACLAKSEVQRLPALIRELALRESDPPPSV
jgi:YesN/AraC family two-component response regulator